MDISQKKAIFPCRPLFLAGSKYLLQRVLTLNSLKNRLSQGSGIGFANQKPSKKKNHPLPFSFGQARPSVPKDPAKHEHLPETTKNKTLLLKGKIDKNLWSPRVFFLTHSHIIASPTYLAELSCGLFPMHR